MEIQLDYGMGEIQFYNLSTINDDYKGADL